MRRHLLFASALWCACTVTEAPTARAPLELEILGYRALIELGEGRYAPSFDRLFPPIVRSPAAMDRGWRLSWRDPAGGLHVLDATDVRRRDQQTLVTFESPGLRAETSTVTIEVHRRDGEIVHRFPAVIGPPPEDLPELREPVRRRIEGEHRQALMYLRERLPGMTGPARLWGTVELARALSNTSDRAAAVLAWKEAAEVARGSRYPTEVSRRLRAASDSCLWLRRFREMEPLLSEAEAIDRKTGHTLGLALASYYRGRMEKEVADYRSSIQHLQYAARETRARGADREAADATLILAGVLQESGRDREALATLESIAPVESATTTLPKRRAYFFNSLGWIELRAMTSGALPLDLERPKRAFLEARALWRALDLRADESNEATNLAWIALLEGDTRSAGGLLREARDLEPSGSGLAGTFNRLLEGEIFLRESALDDALRAYQSALVAASDESPIESELLWQAWYGIGKTHEKRGDHDQALAAFREALAILERIGARTALTVSRGQFFEDRWALVADTVVLLLRTNAADEAFRTIDRARSMVLRGLDASFRLDRLSAAERREWESIAAAFLSARDAYEHTQSRPSPADPLSLRVRLKERAALRAKVREEMERAYAHLDRVDQHRAEPSIAPHPSQIREALAPDEALLSIIDLEEGEPHAFLIRRSGLEHRRTRDPISTWGEAWRTIRHLYVVADVDSRDGLWVEGMSMSFIPSAGFLSRSAAPAHGRSLVVADPTGELPRAREEGAAVAAALGDATLLAGTAATRRTVLASWDGLRVFSFSGHGVLRTPSAWDAQLRLAGEEAVTISDVLISRPSIRLTILSGCETGVLLPLSRRFSVGMPEAFLMAGSSAVLASTRIVGDDEAKSFIERFILEGGLNSPAEGHHRAAAALRAEGKQAWSAFILFGRRNWE